MSNQAHFPSATISPLGYQLLVAVFCRFLLKTGRRFVYPFAAVVSSALGVSLVAITLLLALNQVAALLSPLFGKLSDRWGYRTVLAWGVMFSSFAMLAVGVLPSYTVLMIGLLALGIGISICDPALHAYIGTYVPFAKRGQAMGLTELAWAGSSLVGIPVAGWLVQGYGWHTPFLVMGAVGIVGAMVLGRLLPSHATLHSTCHGYPQPSNLHTTRITRLLQNSSPITRHPAVRAMLFYACMVSCASDIFFVTYALWLTDGYAMGVVALGLATVAIGLAELCGELLTATVADRLGLARTMLLTLLVTALCYALLPLWGSNSTIALIGIFLLCLAAEFSLIAAMSLCTELRPDARAPMMAWFQASSGIGHVVGVVVGGWLWWTGGIFGVGLVCAALCVVSFFVVRWGLAQWHVAEADVVEVNEAAPVLGHAMAQPLAQPLAFPSSHSPLFIWYHQLSSGW